MNEIWTQEEEANRLRARFELLKSEKDMGQAEFARVHKVPGGASLLSQHILNRRPINLGAATAYAKGFDCSIGDISPRLAKEVAEASLISPATQAMHQFVERRKTVRSTDLVEANGIRVPLLANAASMGHGTELAAEDVITDALTLSPSWISSTLRPTSISSLRFIHGYGDSMAPTFNSGDVLLVDTGVVEVKIDGVFVLQAHGRLFIKRVRQRMDGHFEISSDNPTHKTVDTLSGDHTVEVMGRVLWIWNGKKL